MSENDPSAKEVYDLLKSLLGEGGVWRERLGKRTAQFVLASIAILAVELSYGLPIISLATVPFAGVLVVFLWDSVVVWWRSGKPKIIYYACPKEKKFIPILWDDIPKYRDLHNCDCGAKLIKRCPSGEHYIISRLSTSLADEYLPPTENSVCTKCDPPSGPLLG